VWCVRFKVCVGMLQVGYHLRFVVCVWGLVVEPLRFAICESHQWEQQGKRPLPAGKICTKNRSSMRLEAQNR